MDKEKKKIWVELREWRNEKLAEMQNLKKSLEMVGDHQILTMGTSHINVKQLEDHRLICNDINQNTIFNIYFLYF